MCYFRCMLVTSTPTKIMLLGAVFQVLQNPYAEIRKFVTGVCSGTPIHACWSKSVQDKCLKGRVVLMTQKKQNVFWCCLEEPLGQFPRTIFMRVCTLLPQLYSRFHPNPFRLEGVIPRKPFLDPQSEYNIGSSSV